MKGDITFIMQNEIMTIQEVAEYLRVSERTIYAWTSRGQIPCGKLGNTWRFKRLDIEQWVDKRLGFEKTSVLPDSVFIKDILSHERILLFDTVNKKEAFSYLIDSLVDALKINNREKFKKEIFNREELMSTGVGLGIGIPHVRLDSVNKILMAVGISKTDIAGYDALDGKPVRMIFMIAAAKGQHKSQVKIEAALSSKLKDYNFRDALLKAKDDITVLNLLTK